MTGTLLKGSERARDSATAVGFVLIALVMRIWHLSRPKGFIFDEVYYAKNAHSLVQHGVELQANGNAEFIVHPPVGKWLIGLGIKAFGFNEFGWRFSSALIGAISVGLIFLLARKLFDSYYLACTASLLSLVDGLHLVHSRTALLDIFLMFFLLLSVYFIAISKPWFASISLGLALGTKWSGIYYMVALGAFMLYVDFRNQKALETEFPIREVVKKNLLKRMLQFGIIPIAIYIASWSGWFLTRGGWDRTWSKSPISSFIHYHSEMWNFHTNLTEAHSYSANPWSWLIMGRPTSFFYASPKSCGTSACSQEILALGTPLLWWSAVVAIVITIGYWLARREWQSGFLLLAVAAGYAPWFLMQKRTMFTFYAIAFEPFLILVIVYALSKFLERDQNGLIPRHRLYATYVWLTLVVVNFWYFLPLYTADVITYTAWFNRMWLPSWI